MRCLAVITTISLFCVSYPASVFAKTLGHGSEVYWEYAGEGEPKNRIKIKNEHKACRLGKAQSPVDLKVTIGADPPALEIDYKSVPLTILNKLGIQCRRLTPVSS